MFLFEERLGFFLFIFFFLERNDTICFDNRGKEAVGFYFDLIIHLVSCSCFPCSSIRRTRMAHPSRNKNLIPLNILKQMLSLKLETDDGVSYPTLNPHRHPIPSPLQLTQYQSLTLAWEIKQCTFEVRGEGGRYADSVIRGLEWSMTCLRVKDGMRIHGELLTFLWIFLIGPKDWCSKTSEEL